LIQIFTTYFKTGVGNFFLHEGQTQKSTITKGHIIVHMHIKFNNNKVICHQNYTVLIRMHVAILVILNTKKATEKWAKGHKYSPLL